MLRTSLVAGAVGLALVSFPALAAPGAGLASDSASPSMPTLVEQVHGCHRACVLGPAGWHFHAGPRCVRVSCVPRPGPGWYWRNGRWWR